MRDMLGRWLALLLLGGLLAASVVIVEISSSPAPSADALTTSTIVIELRENGFVYSSNGGRVLSRGGDVRWRNRSGRTLEVTSPNGVLDSGPIPDGGSFYASLPVPGGYVWETEVGVGLVYVAAEFEGSLAALANDSIPDVPPPPIDPSDVSLHPTLRILLSRSRFIVGFAPTATVQQAQAALGNDWEIIGGLPRIGLVVVRRSSALSAHSESVLEQLRSRAGVEFVAHDAPVEVDALPAPSDDAADLEWYWDSPVDAPAGRPNNWGLEHSGVPQAWNLLDVLADRGADGRITTLVVDSGFEPHPDLDRLEILRLCANLFELFCTSAEPDSHGNLVAGMVGADHDGIGVDGVDPFGRLLGLSFYRDVSSLCSGFTEAVCGATELTSAHVLTAMELYLREVRDGRRPMPDVVNVSVGIGLASPADWWSAWQDKTCGPGPDDDATGTLACLPDREDGRIRYVANQGRMARRTIEAYVRTAPQDPPLFVASTGNNSLNWCEVARGADCTFELAVAQRSAQISSDFAWANENWNPSGDPTLGSNPLLLAESLGTTQVVDGGLVNDPDSNRSVYSNINGNISASGSVMGPATAADVVGPKRGCVATPSGPYCAAVGTSFSTPLVAGVAALLKAWDPALTSRQVRELLLRWRISDTTGGASPRVHAFDALLALPGAARALVDVNDPSADGNRRVVRDATDVETSLDVEVSSRPGRSTDADGAVDVRDFRRFRDAWLLRCRVSPEVGCPAEIALDGPNDHPKFDLNGDGCVQLLAPAAGQRCPSELTFPRFDFNGDGEVSLGATRAVSLRPDGTPAADRAEATEMTDLQVLQSQWDEGSPGALGFAADDLDDLMVSGDVTLTLGTLAAAGATSVEVSVIDAGSDVVLSSYIAPVNSGDDDPVLLVPANAPVRIEVGATLADRSLASSIGPISLRAGEDRTIDPCAAVSIESARSLLRPDERSDVTVRVQGCGDVEGVPVNLTISPVADAGLRFDPIGDDPTGASTTVTTDAEGFASLTVVAGPMRDLYTITATASVTLDEDRVVERTASTVVAISQAYELEPVAVDGDGSGYALLEEWTRPGVPIGPSVNASGRVAFGGLQREGDRYRVYTAPPGAMATDPFTTDIGTGTEANMFLEGEVQLNDAGQVVYQTVRTTGSFEVESTIRRSSGATTDVLGLGTSDTASSERFARVNLPTIDAAGRVLFVGTEGIGGQQYLAERVADAVVTGDGTFGARPRLADDGTTVTTAWVTRNCAEYPERGCNAFEERDGFLDRILIFGQGVQDGPRFAIAEQRVDDWGLLSEPDVSATGDVIAFVGNRGTQRGVFVSVRLPNGSRTDPFPIAGPAALESAGITALEFDRPTVVQIADGPDGPDGDHLLVVVRGRGTRPDGTVAPADGVWVVYVELVGGAGGYGVEAGRSDLVVEVGDVVLGSQVTSLRLADSLAAAASPRHLTDHWVAVHARTADGRNAHLRARSVPPPAPLPAGAVPTGPGSSVTVAAMESAPLSVLATQAAPAFAQPAAGPDPRVPVMPMQVDEPIALPGPHVAAVTVDDDAPVARTTTRVVNRSRSFDGTPAWAVLDQIPWGLSTVVLDTPRYVGPDDEVLLEIPDVGNDPSRNPRFAIGAPLVTDGDANAVEFTFTIGTGENRPPTGTIVGGPYRVFKGQPVTVRALGTDPDFDTVSYAWDLDGDGEFDDHASLIRALTASEIDTIVCGGTCDLDVPYPIAVRITDARGLSSVVTSTITVIPVGQFDVIVQTRLVQVNPGSSGIIYVTATAPEGMAPVTIPLTFEGVPDGWTIGGNPNVTSGSTTQLSVSVPSGAAEGSFPIEVVARFGEDEWRGTVDVVTVFSLIPNCTARVGGVVLDGDGQPLVGATVGIPWPLLFGSGLSTTTDNSGRFVFRISGSEDLVMPAGYRTWRGFSWTASAAGHVNAAFGEFFVSCDETLELTGVLERIRSVDAVTVRAVLGAPNPITPSRPVPVGPPIEGATASFTYIVGSVVTQARETDAGGDAEYGPIPILRRTGQTNTVTAVVSLDGHWPISRLVTLDDAVEGDRIDLGEFALLPICTGTLGGGRVVDQDGQPVADARVSLGNEGAFILTDADGRFDFDREVNLGSYNTPRNLSVRARAPVEWGSTQVVVVSAPLERCGGTTSPLVLKLDRPVPPPVPVEVLGDVVGRVTDTVTGLPIEGARVRWVSQGVVLRNAFTDADGNWEMRDLFIGNEPATQRPISLWFTSAGYWEELRSELLRADNIADNALQVDVDMVAEIRVAVSGRVTDLETGEPLPGALVRHTNAINGFADADGNYRVEGIPLSPRNEPRLVFVTAGGNGFPPTTHWSSFASIEATADGDHVVDLPMLRICDSSSVAGVVLNAVTLQPIAGARVSTDAWFFTSTTDADGRYRIDNIPPGTLNAPRSVRVTASASGFASASASITTFCGSETILDFGTPPGGFGTVRGTVTDAADQPLADVFIGTSWGDATTTAADGTYTFDRAPLTSDGGPRSWTVTARSGSQQFSRAVIVASDADAVADFVIAADDTDDDTGGGDGPVDAAPTAVIAPFGVINEGDRVTFDASGSSDPEGGQITVAWTLFDSVGRVAATGTGPTWSYTFRDDFLGSVRAVVTDGSGQQGSTERSVEARNVAPAVSIEVTSAPVPTTASVSGWQVIEVASTTAEEVTVTGAFTDPGPDDTHVVRLDWGDGAAETVSHVDGTFTATHRYVRAGTYALTAEVCDDDGGCGTAADTVEVTASATVPSVPSDPTGPTPSDPDPADPGLPVPAPTEPAPTDPPPAQPIDPVGLLPGTGSAVTSWLMTAMALALIGAVALRTGRRRSPQA